MKLFTNRTTRIQEELMEADLHAIVSSDVPFLTRA